MSKGVNQKSAGVNPEEIARIEGIIKNNIRENSDMLAMDEEDIEKYNKSRAEIAAFKKEIEDAKNMSNKDWSQSLLKESVKNMMVAQKLASNHLEDGYESRSITPFAELSNALTTAIKTVVDIDNDKEHIELAREKNQLRRAELEDGVITTNKIEGSIGYGTTADMLTMVKRAALTPSTLPSEELK